jgi:hypothetical protein
MIVFKDYLTFKVLGVDINLFSNETVYGLSTVAELPAGRLHYLGNENPSVLAAVFAWQEVNDVLLTEEEIRQVMIDNKLI